MTDPETIVSLARAAFPVEPQPARDALMKYHCPECIDVSNAYGARPWPEISLDVVANNETALLTAAAWRYYLPAVITWCVRDPEVADVRCEYLVYQLEPPQPPKSDEWFAERIGGFSEEQRRVIVAYLDWYREREEAEYSLLEMPTPVHVYRALAFWKGEQ
jgi:hypothetical protein